ncbi:XdhC family protein [Candidimonas humi]|jgi:xanthine dehydrogenase accessory factor|uniref:XdhC family protein n=1 Tax=Candidimonas humi TaxID=683355 RepID=A0ABV8NXI4_9BURK|nr:XdhC family protein [Candidimonas humi]MBV6305856.1 XdhC family protein [Candidimonas humi]
MENLDFIILRTLRDWRSNGSHAVLATVVHTWGSSPRPIGSIMALREDGIVVGSVSGGCIEDDLIARYTQPDAPDALPRNGPPRFLKYGVTADEAHRFGLPCGGTLEIILEFDPDVGSLEELVQMLDTGRLMHRCVRLADGHVHLEPTDVPADLGLDEHELVNTFGPGYRMLIIGAGQMSEYLATMAQFCGFAVTVCDPRKEYSSVWNVPGVRVVDTMPDDTVAEFQPDARSCVIALTHDPKLDDLALLQALETPAFYIGAIGSRRNNQARRERMIEYLDQTEQSLAHLRGPIGIYIGSKTPPEIAVSVMAEVLAVKNGVALPRDTDVAYVKDQQGMMGAGTVCFTG